MLCTWKRFSQCICDIQVRMHFTNLYVSILNIFTNGVEATLDMPCLLVKPELLGKCNSSSVVTEELDRPRCIGYDSEVGDESFTQIASCAASEAAMYSASHVDPATTLCCNYTSLLPHHSKYTCIRFVT